MDIILASTSAYRRRLLSRLQIPFQCVAPEVDETPLPNEQPQALAARLAVLKARAVATTNPSAVIIGSDQVAAIDGVQLGKPGNYRAAMQQLRASSGRTVTFYTGVALICLDQAVERFHVEPFTVQFRRLRDSQISNYLKREQPYDCAGSFKVEGLGIALFERLEGADATSLEGLPLIALTNLLNEAGMQVL